MFGLNLASCCFTSNSDVTVGAFSKWFKYLHPLSAVDETLRAGKMVKDSPESENFTRRLEIFVSLSISSVSRSLWVTRKINERTTTGYKETEREFKVNHSRYFEVIKIMSLWVNNLP